MGRAKPELLGIAAAVAVASAAVSCYWWRRKFKLFLPSRNRIQELEAALKGSLEKCAAERQGRIRAQQALRKALSRENDDNDEFFSYPMAPIGVVHSCFTTRNGTPRQPLLVPLARASLEFYPSRVPEASLEGLEGFTHCWIIFVFHLNTDIEKLWKNPSQSGFKAKVRVPRLKGKRVGVFATRSPHRPCPIGLTVAKLEGRHGCTLLVSDVDLVDGTPILDIKPYLPYCDSIRGADVPTWVKEDNALAISSVNFSNVFSSILADSWSQVEQKSLYASPEEFQSLIKQVLSWDIRSVSQRNRPHEHSCHYNTKGKTGDGSDFTDYHEDDNHKEDSVVTSSIATDVVYHLVLECFDVSYRIDDSANVFVENVALMK